MAIVGFGMGEIAVAAGEGRCPGDWIACQTSGCGDVVNRCHSLQLWVVAEVDSAISFWVIQLPWTLVLVFARRPSTLFCLPMGHLIWMICCFLPCCCLKGEKR